MSLITYVLSVGLLEGTKLRCACSRPCPWPPPPALLLTAVRGDGAGRFTPEVLQDVSTTCLVTQVIEVLLVKAGLFVTRSTPIPFLDLIAYTGYKFFGYGVPQSPPGRAPSPSPRPRPGPACASTRWWACSSGHMPTTPPSPPRPPASLCSWWERRPRVLAPALTPAGPPPRSARSTQPSWGAMQAALVAPLTNPPCAGSTSSLGTCPVRRAAPWPGADPRARDARDPCQCGPLASAHHVLARLAIRLRVGRALPAPYAPAGRTFRGGGGGAGGEGPAPSAVRERAAYCGDMAATSGPYFACFSDLQQTTSGPALSPVALLWAAWEPSQ